MPFTILKIVKSWEDKNVYHKRQDPPCQGSFLTDVNGMVSKIKI